MAAIFYQDYTDSPHRGNFLYEALDGDPSQVKAIGLTREKGTPLLSNNETIEGCRVGPEHIPTRLIRGGQTEHWWDYEAFNGTPLVSEKFKKIVEAREPNTHQFWPMQIQGQDGEHHGTRYWMVVCNRIDSLDRALSTPTLEPPLSFDGFWANGPAEGSCLVLRSDLISDKHVWREVFVKVIWLVSDQLADDCQAAQITGIRRINVEESLLEAEKRYVE